MLQQAFGGLTGWEARCNTLALALVDARSVAANDWPTITERARLVTAAVREARVMG